MIQTVFNFQVKKVPEKQQKQPNNEPDDDGIVPIPFGMFDTNPTTETLLKTSLASTTSESLIDVETTTKVIILGSNTDAPATNKDSPDDYDECVQIPPGMFDTDPISECVVETVATKVANAISIKVKPTTKPTPTRVSNSYKCLANDNNDDENDVECDDRTLEIKQAPRTDKTVKGKNNKKKTIPERKESDSRGDTDT